MHTFQLAADKRECFAQEGWQIANEQEYAIFYGCLLALPQEKKNLTIAKVRQIRRKYGIPHDVLIAPTCILRQAFPDNP